MMLRVNNIRQIVKESKYGKEEYWCVLSKNTLHISNTSLRGVPLNTEIRCSPLLQTFQVLNKNWLDI